jgi:lysophospholipase L1-like esterase
MPVAPGSRYVAMGSSFGAGPGLRPRAPGSPRRAGRSAANYAHLVARALSLDLRDVTFSGATTGDLLNPAAAGQPAQLDAVTPDTALVTITAGGNDVGFLPRLTLASLPGPLRVLPRVRAQVAGLGDPGAADERFARLERNLTEVARRLHDRAPACRVLLVDYLTILPPEGPVSGPPPPEIAAWGRGTAARLAAVTRQAAQAYGLEYVAASAASAGHHAWSAAPWTRRFHLSLRGGAPYHPNAAGMDAVAGLVLAALAGGPPARILRFRTDRRFSCAHHGPWSGAVRYPRESATGDRNRVNAASRRLT